MESERLRRADARIAGLAATALALAALWVAATIVAGAVFVPASITDVIVRATPGAIATFFIEWLGHLALPLLTTGVLAGCLVVGGEALVATARPSGPRPYLAGAMVGAAAALLLVVSAPAIDSLAPTAAALALCVLIYGAAAGRLYGLIAAEADADAGRRRALRSGLGWTAAVALGGGVLGWVSRRSAGPDTNVSLRAAEIPARIPGRSRWPEVEGLTGEVTSAADHYVVDINLFTPSVEADGWRLEVKGEVEEPLRLSFRALQSRFEVVEEYAVLTCVSNEVGGGLVGHSLWGGVRLGDVLKAAGMRPAGVDIVFRAADGYSDSIPAELARDPAVLLAVSQNRRPLTREHGFPCRLRVPPIYGMKNVKWIESIEVVSSDYEGYWQQRGWSDRATVRTQSRIDVAGDDFRATAGTPTWVAGVAWAGDRGVDRVEVSPDGGQTWSEAELRQPIGPLSWRQWIYRWTPERSGEAVVMCRATDGDGATQTENRVPPHPAGATGYHRVTVEVA
jgi:DMSO/TMAO reductase YedYZ molybdopterin-dependent catalytic subunit